jgi:hypothetical protein
VPRGVGVVARQAEKGWQSKIEFHIN